MQRNRLSLMAAILINAGLFLALALSWCQMAVQGEHWRADFTGYYTGWSMVLDGRGPDLYDLELQAEYQYRIAPPLAETPEHQLPFNYPPHLAVLPFLAFLPRGVAYLVWFGVQLGMLALVLRSLLVFVQPASGEEKAVWIVTVLAFPPVMMTLTHGQLSILVLLSQTGMTLALMKGHPWQAAAWFLLGTLKPSLMMIPAVILLAAGQWGVLLRAVALFLPCAAVTTLVLGPGSWLGFLEALRHTASQTGLYGVRPNQMTNVKAILYLSLGPDRLAFINTFNAIALLLLCLLIAVLWRGRWKAGPRLFLTLSLCLQLGTLFNPHQYRHDTVTLILPAVLLWVGCRAERWANWVAGLLAATPLLFQISNEARLAAMVALVGVTAVALVRGGAEPASITSASPAPR